MQCMIFFLLSINHLTKIASVHCARCNKSLSLRECACEPQHFTHNCINKNTSKICAFSFHRHYIGCDNSEIIWIQGFISAFVPRFSLRKYINFKRCLSLNAAARPEVVNSLFFNCNLNYKFMYMKMQMSRGSTSRKR